MNRREAIKRAGILLGGVLSASAISGVMSGCRAEPKTDWTPRFLNPDEASVLEAIVDRIIPQTDTPGAKMAGVPAFIDTMLAEFYQENERKRLLEGIRQIEADAKTAHKKSFTSLSPEQQDEILTRYDKEAYSEQNKQEKEKSDNPHFFRTLKELTVLGFCTSEAGATEFLKYDPIPGDYKGCVPYAEIGAAWAT